MGPCSLAKDLRERCGVIPNWWRLPIIGSFDGEGGRFLLLGLMENTHLITNMARIREIMKEGSSKNSGSW